jgi:hypothetical protein
MNICNYTSRFSRNAFRHLSEVFGYELSFSELGMTDLFVLDLVRFSQQVAPFQVEVYKTSWPVEKPYGNDIDLFVQDATGQYDWYALQAKVMSHEGVFNDLKVKKPGTIEEQWHKLLLHEYLFGSQAFYLLYVGQSKTNFPKRLFKLVGRAGECWRGRAMHWRGWCCVRSLWPNGGWCRPRRCCARRPSAWRG